MSIQALPALSSLTAWWSWKECYNVGSVMRKLWFDCVGQFRVLFGELGKHAKGKVAKGEGLLKSATKVEG